AANWFASMRADRATVLPQWPKYHPRWRAERRGRGGAGARTALDVSRRVANRAGKAIRWPDRETDAGRKDRDGSIRLCADAPAWRPAVVRRASSTVVPFLRRGQSAIPSPVLRAPAKKRGPDRPRPRPTTRG